MSDLQQHPSNVNLSEVVARLQKEKSDVTASGFRMGKHLDVERRDPVKRLGTQAALIERLGYVILAGLLLAFVWGRITGKW